MKKFQHPNLIKIYDYMLNEETSELEIVMEYCPKGDLAKYLKSHKRLSGEEVI